MRTKHTTEKMLIVSFSIFLSLIVFKATLQAQASPWGTGMINNQNIGLLDDTTVVFSIRYRLWQLRLLPQSKFVAK